MATVSEVINGVLVGYNNYLFLNDGGHDVVAYATGRRIVEQVSIQNFHRNIDRRASAASELGAQYLHLIIPDKQSALQREFPLDVTCCLGSIYAAPYRHLGRVLYPLSFLENLEPSPYLKTDTHLVHSASIHLAGKIAEHLENDDLKADIGCLLADLKPELNITGDLGSKLNPTVAEARLVNGHTWPTTWIHNQFDGNNGIVDIRLSPGRKYTKRILIFGDSFGRDLGLFLSYLYEEVVFLRTPFFHVEIATEIHPDIIITECVERYLDSVVSDDDRPSFFMYPYLTGRHYQPSPEFAEAFSAILSYPRTAYAAFREAALGI